MNALRALQKLETQIVEKVCQQMGIEEDDLDIEVDLLRVYNMDAAEREGELVRYVDFLLMLVSDDLHLLRVFRRKLCLPHYLVALMRWLPKFLKSSAKLRTFLNKTESE